jgi:formylglycine-generating enzyme required for sulfatase activity
MNIKLRYHLLYVLTFLVGVRPSLAQTSNVNLSIASAGNQAVLFWPVSVTNFVLQTTTNLASTNWVNVTNAVQVTAFTVTDTSPASFFRLYQPAIPVGMALIPAGAFIMGDTLDGEADATPIIVTLSAFFMDTNPVSYSLWQSVYSYATIH